MTTCHLLQKIAAVGILLSSVAVSVSAQDAPVENDYYQMDSFKLPEGLVLEIGGIEWFNEKLAISTRRGDIYMVENALAKEIGDAKLKPFAIGLHEVLGLTQKDGWLYATQRGRSFATER